MLYPEEEGTSGETKGGKRMGQRGEGEGGRAESLGGKDEEVLKVQETDLN